MKTLAQLAVEYEANLDSLEGVGMQQESITFEQLLSELAKPSRPRHITEAETVVMPAVQAPQKQAQPGTEMLKSRLRVTIDFDVTVNDGKIRNSGSDADVRNFEQALLQKFLTADKNKLKELLLYHIALKLGYDTADDMEKMLLGQCMPNNWEHHVYGPAIDALEGPAGEYWREVRDMPPEKGLGDVLGLCTEAMWSCFKAQFVASSAEIVEE